MDPEKQRLNNISKRVHQALRMLKMGETGTIICDKEFNEEAIREYVMAYAFHKKKWFKVKYDQATNVLYAERAPPPPWEKEPEVPELEEP